MFGDELSYVNKMNMKGIRMGWNDRLCEGPGYEFVSIEEKKRIRQELEETTRLINSKDYNDRDIIANDDQLIDIALEKLLKDENLKVRNSAKNNFGRRIKKLEEFLANEEIRVQKGQNTEYFIKSNQNKLLEYKTLLEKN